MRKLRIGATAMSLLTTLAFVASAQAVPSSFTSSNVTTPADGSFLFQNLDSSPNQPFTVSGTVQGWVTGDLAEVDCYSSGGTTNYTGPSSSGITLQPDTDGNFSISVPQSFFASDSCTLAVVPYGFAGDPGTNGYTGPRVGFSAFQSSSNSSNKTSNGALFDYSFDDAATLGNVASDAIDDCGPYSYLLGGTSSVDIGGYLFNCGGSFYTSLSDRIDGPPPGPDLPASEIQVDGQNAYGSVGADFLFSGSSSLSGFPALDVSLDSFDTSNGDAQTTESEPLVECTPDDVYSPTASDCAAFVSTGVAIKRVTDYTNDGRVVTVTDTFTSTDGQAHSLDLQYETDLGDSAAGWKLPGQTSFTTPSTTTDVTEPGPSTAPDTAYAIDDPTSSPSLSNPVGAATFSVPYNSVTFDDTIWGAVNPSALFDFTPMVPAGGSTSITWSYATGTTLAEVQGYAAAAAQAMAAAEDAAQPPAVAISSPSNGATETSTPVTVTGTASAGSGVASVTVNGVAATISGDKWSASVPLTAGANTLTATLTSDAGNTATAAATVTYTPPVTVTTPPSTSKPPARISIKSKRFNGTAELVKLACAAGGANCAGKITLRYTHTVVKHHKKHRVTVVIASKRYALAAGHTATISVGLNGTGRGLLRAEHRLPGVKGTVTLSGGHAKTFAVTLKQPAKHKK